MRFPSDRLGDTSAWLAAAHQLGLGPDVEIAAIRAALRHVDDYSAERPLSINASPAAVLADLVLSPMLYIGAVLLYGDLTARRAAGGRRSPPALSSARC